MTKTSALLYVVNMLSHTASLQINPTGKIKVDIKIQNFKNN